MCTYVCTANAMIADKLKFMRCTLQKSYSVEEFGIKNYKKFIELHIGFGYTVNLRIQETLYDSYLHIFYIKFRLSNIKQIPNYDKIRYFETKEYICTYTLYFL